MLDKDKERQTDIQTNGGSETYRHRQTDRGKGYKERRKTETEQVIDRILEIKRVRGAKRNKRTLAKDEVKFLF